MAKKALKHQITISVVKGGYVLDYPVKVDALSEFGIIDSHLEPTYQIVTEVFMSQRKLNQRLKEVIETVAPSSETED